MALPIVQCTGVTYRYRGHRAALADLHLAIEPGAFVLLAGASGSGKSTLCRLLNGLIPHLHDGELHGVAVVDGQDIRTTPPHVLSRSVGLLLQQPDAQCFGATVARDIAFGPACQGLDRATIAARVREAAEQLQITDLLQRTPHTLSGGEQQRVALAGVWALRPMLLVLDEPFAFLDAAGADRLRATLRHLHREGVTIIVAEHRLGEIAADATRMVVLQAGRIVADAPPREVLTQDVTAWDLEAPSFIQLARAARLSATPLTLDEAVDLLGGQPIPVDVRSPRQDVSAPQNGQPAPVLGWERVWFERDGRAVLRDIDLRVAAGMVLGLLGANGAGKTSLLRLANGLLRPQRGTVRVCGRPVGRRPVAELAQEVGLVVQQPTHMLFAPTVRAEIEAGPRALRRHDPTWCAALIERFGLGSLCDQAPQRLSAGEQRRVALAAVLAARPRALLLDEPTVGQDAHGRRTLYGLVEEAASHGTAVVVATHDTEWVYPLATNWTVLADGQLVMNGTPVVVCDQAQAVARARLRLPAVIALRHALVAGEETHGFHR
jgi:energy-coupling factor transporter ATP-binding protein EcfA2